MTDIAAALLSMFVLSGLVWLAARVLRRPLCPICLGVGGTWAWMLGARFAGYAIDATILAVLLGASVVGSAYQLEKHLGQGRSQLLWKALFIPAGVVAAYAVVAARWSMAVVALLALASLTAFFRCGHARAGANAAAVTALEEKLKKCC